MLTGMRALITTSPLYGHFVPMLPLIDAFRHAGHDVTVATGPDLADAVRRRDLRAWIVGPSMTDLLVGLRTPRPEPETDRLTALRRDAITYFGEPGVARARELLDLIATEPPDLVVHEHSDLAGWVIAAVLGQRPIAHGYGPHLPLTRDLARILLDAAQERLGVAMPVDDPFAEAVYLDPWPARLRSAERIGYGRVLPIRPEPEPARPGESLPAAVEGLPHDRTVYATLGTVFTDPRTMRDVVAALRDVEANLVLTTGHAVDPAVLGPLPDDVTAAAFLPQALVLPGCAAVISHAGSGTVIGALAHHLPQVCLPSGADQFINADRIAACGAGLDLPPDARQPGRIRDALLTVLDEPSFAAAARELQGDIDKMPAAAEVVPELLATSR